MKVLAIDFETANGSFCSACSIGYCVMENGEINYTDVYIIEGKTVLLYQLYNYAEGDSGIIPDDIMEKLNKKFEKVNEGIINNYDGMYQEDTYKDDMIDAMG